MSIRETPGSGLPPTSNGKSPQHFAFIRSLQAVPGGWLLEVFPIVSFSRRGGALEGYHQAPDSAKEALIPLPAFSHQHLTPALFGDPLTIGGCSTPRPSFLHIVPYTFVISSISSNRSFKRTIPPASLSPVQLIRIEEYRNALRLTRGGTPQGGTTGGVSNASVQTWASVVSGGRGNVAAREDLADIMTSDGVLILEGVDEDADGEDCTWKDQLILLAYGDPAWIPVLQSYLQEEREEEEKLQGERMRRLTSWLQGMPPELAA